ncbi:MAG: hypothetical protein AAFZ15_08875 [Bacteroidota bacterium]
MKLHKTNDWDVHSSRQLNINLKDLKILFNSLAMDIEADPNPDPEKINLRDRMDKLIEQDPNQPYG